MTYAGAVQQLKSYIDMKLCAISKALSIKVDAIGASSITPTSTTTFTNKTIDGAGNTLTNIPQSAVSGGGFVDKSTNQTAIAGTKQVTSQWTFASAWAATQAIFGITGQGGRITFLNGTAGTSLLTVGATAVTGDGASIISSGSTGLAISNTGTGGALTLSATDSAAIISFSRGGTVAGRINTTGNWMFQAGGTYTDSGQFLQVVGATKLAGSPTTSGSSPFVSLIAAANTNQTASTDTQDILINLSRTVQFATGAKAIQRAILVTPPTYSAVGATTVSQAATFVISGPPVAGTNVTLSGSYGFWVQNGLSFLEGGAYISNGANVNGSLGVTNNISVNNGISATTLSITTTSNLTGKVTTGSDFESTKASGGLILLDTVTGVRQLIRVTNGIVVVSAAP